VPKPWVHVKARFLISQLDYTLARMQLYLKVRTNTTAIVVALNARFWNYGEEVNAVLPPACA
jgi:hypothetical protein